MYHDIKRLNKVNKSTTIITIIAMLIIILILGELGVFSLMILNITPLKFNTIKSLFTQNIIQGICAFLQILVTISYISYATQVKADLRRLRFGHKNYYDYNKDPKSFKVISIIILVFSVLDVILNILVSDRSIILIILSLVVLILLSVLCFLLFKTANELKDMIILDTYVEYKNKREAKLKNKAEQLSEDDDEKDINYDSMRV